MDVAIKDLNTMLFWDDESSGWLISLRGFYKIRVAVLVKQMFISVSLHC